MRSSWRAVLAGCALLAVAGCATAVSGHGQVARTPSTGSSTHDFPSSPAAPSGTAVPARFTRAP
ncbi:MAG TPA: hypothetical protein VFU35_02420, partial [Jatrophihabitans sp.]|nr:hypothetical protein [Jatrophihabitans sp.]